MISVVVPAYNEEQNIRACLESLEGQTFPRDQYEVIVVDGGSKDRTREIAAEYADLVFIQTAKKVGGARNDGALKAAGEILATTDADCIIPPDWLEVIAQAFARDPETVQLYGPVVPMEGGIKNHIFLALANNFSRFGYYTSLFSYTLGCNTAFRKEAFLEAGMYRTIDAGDDLEIARRMRTLGKVRFENRMRVVFSMRRYDQFGTIRSLYEWVAIVARGGESEKYSYSRREYK
ncbi:MAG: glycosyltransferase [Methanoregulaceae archaeon]|jgi:glycosyltransferase involved in cell wall biosynthesis